MDSSLQQHHQNQDCPYCKNFIDSEASYCKDCEVLVHMNCAEEKQWACPKLSCQGMLSQESQKPFLHPLDGSKVLESNVMPEPGLLLLIVGSIFVAFLTFLYTWGGASYYYAIVHGVSLITLVKLALWIESLSGVKLRRSLTGMEENLGSFEGEFVAISAVPNLLHDPLSTPRDIPCLWYRYRTEEFRAQRPRLGNENTGGKRTWQFRHRENHPYQGSRYAFSRPFQMGQVLIPNSVSETHETETQIWPIYTQESGEETVGDQRDILEYLPFDKELAVTGQLVRENEQWTLKPTFPGGIQLIGNKERYLANLMNPLKAWGLLTLYFIAVTIRTLI